MTIADDVREVTGLDLRDATLVADTLAPQFAKRLERLYANVDVATDVARKIYQAYRTLTAATTVAGVLQAAYAAISGTLAQIYGAASKATKENLERREATRNGFIRRYYRPGAFAQVLGSKRAPLPAALDLTRGLKDPRKHLDQYDTDYVWHVSRVGRGQTLWPTWTTRPYDSPGGSKDVWVNGYNFPEQLLGGYRGNQFATRPRSIGAIAPKYADKYWGNAPNGGNVDASPQLGEWGKLDWAPLDAAVFISGYAPPIGYEYLFSWGTYPFTSWTSIFGLDALRRFDDCADAAGLAAAIHGITPIHAQIRWAEVEACYRHFLRMSGWRSWPVTPAKQVDAGLYIDPETALPFSPIPGYPVPIGPYQVPWEVIKNVEQLFRDWFRIRTAIVFQAGQWSDNFRAGAKDSPDPVIRTLAAGAAPPAWRGFRELDPLGEGWRPGVQVVQYVPPAERPQYGGAQGLAAGGIGGPLALAGAAVALARMFRSRRA